MPRNISKLKSGGTIPMLSPHPEKWGDASPRPPPIDARDCESNVMNVQYYRLFQRERKKIAQHLSRNYYCNRMLNSKA